MKIHLLLLFILISSPLLAQEHIVFSPISSIHGLSDNRVRTINQLKDGRMVIVTEGLVNIYDGAGFQYMHYNEQQAYFLKNYFGYHRTYVDSENHLWLKNQQKLMLFDIRTEQFVPNVDSIFSAQGIKNKVVNFFMDTDLNHWYVTENNELLRKNSSNKLTSMFIPDLSEISVKDDQLLEVTVRDKQLFLFFKSGLMICYDLDSTNELYRENIFQGTVNWYSSTIMVVPHKQFLYQARNGFSRGQLVRFNILNRKWERIMETDYWLNTLSVDKNGDCWISSFSGLWHIDKGLQHKRLVSPLHLVDGRIFDSEICTQFNDDQGGLWVGTVNRGFLYYHPDRFKFRNFGNSLFNQSGQNSISVFSFAENNGQLLVGTQNGLFSTKHGEKKLEPLSIISTDSRCEMLFKDSKNRIWVCTQNDGLYLINGNNTRHYKKPNHCIYIYETFDGRLFLCTNDGPGIFDPESGQFKQAKTIEGEPISRTYQLTYYKSDLLLGYSDKGLFFYDINNNIISFPEKGNPILQNNNYQYHCLYTDSRGLIWLGTMDGLNVYNPETRTIKTFHEKDGLVNNSIRSVVEDNTGRIWVTTSNGISCIEPDQDDYLITNYNRYDGVIENEFLPRSVLKTSDNRLLWGGLDGFNELHLSSIELPEPRLNVPLITRFSLAGTEIKLGENYDGHVILNQSITTTKEINLKYFQNFFNIEFSALNYINPAQTYYRYQLEGVDASWREIKSTDGIGNANYTNLSPGTYYLKVFAVNNKQEWNNEYAELVINIHPPFWKTKWAYFAYAILFFGVLFLTLKFYIKQSRRKLLKQQKEAVDQMKFSFFTNISHELRTPLSLILTPLDSLLKRVEDNQLKSQLSGIYSNAHILLNLVNQLLSFRKLEMTGETLHLCYCKIGEFFETIMPSFKELAREKEINFTFECVDADLMMYVDKDKFHRIINNLLSNAFKFTPKHGEVRMKIEKQGDSMLKIEVTDTGCGIAKEELPYVFDRFYQAKNQNNQAGSGIGLHLVKVYTEMHKGAVEAESRINEGTTFKIYLPLDQKPTNFELISSKLPEKKHALTILVVEDHAEFRAFLSSELSDKYNIITANNGKGGLQKVREHHPDLVISDVMMPEMLGTELCKQLKKDLQISHIPVILLTAKSSDEAQIEGLLAGADAYVSKPFNMDILLLRIQNLIEQQEQRKNSFRKNIVVTPGLLTSNHIDEELIQKVLIHVEKNMANASYSVDQLSKDMFMDRTGLYRKISAITGHSPTQFIRSVRLKKAAQLLQNGLPVAEVANQVGFGTTSYFTKCFQEEFSTKPSNYKNQKVN